MRKLEKIIRKVRYHGNASKLLPAVLLVLIAIWLAAASSLPRVGSVGTFDGFDDRLPSYSCGLAIAGGCSAHMLLDPLILARHVKIAPPVFAKPPHRPGSFTFRTVGHGPRGKPEGQ